MTQTPSQPPAPTPQQATSQSQADLPTIRLKPKANAQAIRRGFPWVYANEAVIDRRTRALAAGTIARLEDGDRRFLGTVAVTPDSKIIARMLTPEVEERPDTAWFRARLQKAHDLRARMYPTPYYRLIHAEADGLPGIIIDRFGDTCVMQPNAAWAERLLEPLTEALAEVTGVTTILKNSAGRGRALEGLDDTNAVLLGAAPDGPLPVQMNGATYFADLTGGQKTGLYYDQRANHAMAAGLAQGGKVLDVFSHVGGFGLSMLAGGADSALCVDGSAPALALAQKGAEAMGAAARLDTRCGDAFETLSDLFGHTFDVVVCDPPAFAPSKTALDAGLRAYEKVARLAADLVAEDGYLVLCSCSHAADMASFRGACLRGIGRAGRRAQLIHTGQAGPDHPLLPQLAESGYLKALFFRL
ncbi:MAG: RSP_2647 family RNA methyltransferase [Paracoccaceae bacterium]